MKLFLFSLLVALVSIVIYMGRCPKFATSTPFLESVCASVERRLDSSHLHYLSFIEAAPSAQVTIYRNGAQSEEEQTLLSLTSSFDSLSGLVQVAGKHRNASACYPYHVHAQCNNAASCAHAQGRVLR
jgi:hypothetical protein